MSVPKEDEEEIAIEAIEMKMKIAKHVNL